MKYENKICVLYLKYSPSQVVCTVKVNPSSNWHWKIIMWFMLHIINLFSLNYNFQENNFREKKWRLSQDVYEVVLYFCASVSRDVYY